MEIIFGLLKHLKKHKLRSKLKLRLLEEGELDVWSVWKEDERWTAHAKAESEEGIIALTYCRAPGLSQRLLLPPSSSGGALKDRLEEVRKAPISAYTIRRYLRGVAEGQVEIPWRDSLPTNCNIELMGGIDIKKGCYLGQELTIRTHHTGVVRRRILPVALFRNGQESRPQKLEYDPSFTTTKPENNADVRRDGARKRSTGKFISAIGNIGLAMCRLEAVSKFLEKVAHTALKTVS